MSFLSQHRWFVILLLMMAATAGYAQDTTRTLIGSPQPRQSRPGFDLPDSLYRIADTLGTDGGIDTIVQYTAKDSIVFDVSGRRMILVNDASMNFQGRTLNAYTIVVDFNNSTLTAYSDDYDSVIENSLSRRRRIIRDTNRVASRGAPILREGDTPYEGEIIVYNFKTRKGTVQLGTSTMEGGFYYGERIKQVDKNTLFVQNGRFTTCDAPVPHYYFESPKMKVEMRDKVFAAPVYLFISDVPIFALPFGLFPNHGGGRRSGIIPPNYQTTGSRGFGLTNLGYYQVFSDYFDAAVQASIYTKGGYNAEMRAAFMKRYWLSGPASLKLGYGFSRFSEDEPFKKEWDGQFMLPNLLLGLNTRLNANLTFRSSGYSQSTAQSINDLLDQSTTSNAAFSTNWEESGISLDIGYSRHQDLLKGTYQETSPSFSINKTQFRPFAPSVDAESTNGGFFEETAKSLAIGYNVRGQRSLNRERPGDSTVFVNREQYGILHSPSISLSPKFGYFGVTPSFNYSEAWFFRYLEKSIVNVGGVDVIDSHMVNKFRRLYRYDLGVNVQTKLIGIANIGALGVNAIRHIISPSIDLRYSPDLSEQSIGRVTDRTGATSEYNIFQNDLNSGLASGKESMNLGFGISNNFEAKVNHQVNADSVTEDKVKLLDLSLNSGFDVIQDRFANLSMTASSAVGSSLSLNADALFSFYPRNSFGGDSLEHTMISLGQGLLRPLNARLSLSGNFSSPTGIDGENVDSLRRLFNVETPEDERALLLGGVFPGRFVYVPFRPTWNLGYSFSYTEDYINDETKRNFSGYANLTLSLTRNWSISTGASYDFVNKRILVPSIRVTRDLHCWEMNFDYRPTGFARGFNFEIRIKAEQLRDVKLTRTENSFGSF